MAQQKDSLSAILAGIGGVETKSNEDKNESAQTPEVSAGIQEVSSRLYSMQRLESMRRKMPFSLRLQQEVNKHLLEKGANLQANEFIENLLREFLQHINTK